MWNNWELKRPTAYRPRSPLCVMWFSFHLCPPHSWTTTKKILSSPSAYRPLLFVPSSLPSFPSFTLVVACFMGVFLQCISLLELGLCMQTHAWCVCVCVLYLCVCVCVSVLSLYSLLMYSATYILPFQVLQVLLTSQTLGTCSWACRVWMGILTKGHKSEPMYSHR